MKVRILDRANDDLVDGFWFYEQQSRGLGPYFRESLREDIDSLARIAGVHRVVGSYHRLISRKFPYAVFYRMMDGEAWVYTVVDCRRSAEWLRERLPK